MTHIIAIIEGVESTVLANHLDNLPWFNQMINKEGYYFPLECGPVPYEIPNLTTAMTGVGPGSHGCYSYWEIHDIISDKPRVLESFDVKYPRIWEWESLRDIKWSVVNMQLTHPPRPLRGYSLSYLMQQSLRASYPVYLQREMSKKGIRYAHDVSAFYRGEAPEEFAEKILTIATLQLEAAYFLAKESDVLIVNLTIADRLSHFLWAELNQKETLGRKPYVLQAYNFLDNALKKLQSLLNNKEFMLVFSEIGFGPLKEFVSIDHYLQTGGLQTVDSEGRVDNRNSVACEAVQGSHGINLTNPSISHYDRLVEDVCAYLMSLKFEDNTPILASAKPREKVYQGPWMHLAPDIIINPYDLERPPLGDPRWARHVNRHLQTGWHRPEGFGILLGADILPGREKHPLSLTCIAPTIAYLLGAKAPYYCEGAVMEGFGATVV